MIKWNYKNIHLQIIISLQFIVLDFISWLLVMINDEY